MPLISPQELLIVYTDVFAPNLLWNCPTSSICRMILFLQQPQKVAADIDFHNEIYY